MKRAPVAIAGRKILSLWGKTLRRSGGIVSAMPMTKDRQSRQKP
jgi:hypothetical protein